MAKIYCQTMATLVDELYNVFKTLADPENKRKYRKNDQSCWTAFYPDSKILIFGDLFPGRRHTTYWLEKKSKHLNSKEVYEHEPTATMIEALNILGYRIEKFVERTIDEEQEFKILYHIFLRDKCEEFIIPQEDRLELVKYEKDANELAKKPRSSVEQNIQDALKDKFIITAPDLPELPKHAFGTIFNSSQFKDWNYEKAFHEKFTIQFMHEYIACLSKRNYGDAFDFWNHDERNQKWGYDPTKFAASFYLVNFISQDLCKVLQVQVNSGGFQKHVNNRDNKFYATCLLYYVEGTYRLNDEALMDLAQLKGYTLKEHGLFSEKLAQLNERAESLEYKDLQSLTIRDILSKNIPTALEISDAGQLGKLDKMFPGMRLAQLSRIFKVSLSTTHRLHGYTWHIDNIEPAKLDTPSNHR